MNTLTNNHTLNTTFKPVIKAVIKTVLSFFYKFLTTNNTTNNNTKAQQINLTQISQTNQQTATKALQSAINLCGSQSNLAKRLNATQGQISIWLNRDKKVPITQVLAIESALNNQITRYDLRPDIYGTAPTLATLSKQAFSIIRAKTKPITKPIAILYIIIFGFALNNLTPFGSAPTLSVFAVPNQTQQTLGVLGHTTIDSCLFSK